MGNDDSERSAWQGSLDGLVGPREQAFWVGFRRFDRFHFMGRAWYSQGLFKKLSSILLLGLFVFVVWDFINPRP